MTKRIKTSDLVAVLFGAILAVGMAAFSGDAERAPAPPPPRAGAAESAERGPA